MMPEVYRGSVQVTGLKKQATPSSDPRPERIRTGRTVIKAEPPTQPVEAPDIPQILPGNAKVTRTERAQLAQPTLHMMEQSVHTMHQTSLTGTAYGTSDFRHEVRVGVKRIVVSDLPPPPQAGSVPTQGALLTVTPALILGVLTGIGAALIASAVHAPAVVVGLCYGLPVAVGLFLTILRNARHHRQ